MDGAAGENFSFRLQRASFLSFWEQLRQEIQASTDAVRLWGLVSANMDLFKKRVRRPSVGPPPPYRGTPHILRIHGFADVDPYEDTPLQTLYKVGINTGNTFLVIPHYRNHPQTIWEPFSRIF